MVDLKNIIIEIVEYRVARGKAKILVPDYVKKRYAVLNMDNLDNYCFVYCVSAHIHSEKFPSHENHHTNYL